MHSAGREAQTKAKKTPKPAQQTGSEQKTFDLQYMAANMIFWGILFFLGKWTFQGINDT